MWNTASLYRGAGSLQLLLLNAIVNGGINVVRSYPQCAYIFCGSNEDRLLGYVRPALVEVAIPPLPPFLYNCLRIDLGLLKSGFDFGVLLRYVDLRLEAGSS
jgi:hypothetical protein